MREIHIIGVHHGQSKNGNKMTSVMDTNRVPDFYENFREILLNPSTILIPESFSNVFCRRRLISPDGKNYQKIIHEIFGRQLETKCALQLVDSRKNSVFKEVFKVADIFIRLGRISLSETNDRLIIPNIQIFQNGHWFKTNYESNKRLFLGYAYKIEDDVCDFILRNNFSNTIVVIVGIDHVEGIRNKLSKTTNCFKIHDYTPKNETKIKVRFSNEQKLKQLIAGMIMSGQIWSIFDLEAKKSDS